MSIAELGGFFSILVFWHFVADWIFQSHDEAMKKSKNHEIRAIHCMIYTICFFPLLCVLPLTTTQLLISVAILFFSHFIEDTYVPVMLWAKHIRKAPEFNWHDRDEDAFIAFASTPLGKILAIVVDQLVHIAFLLPIAYMAAQ